MATGVRNEAAAATVTHISTGLAETSMSAAAETATGITISAVAMLLISWPSADGQHEQPEQQRVAAAVADDPHEPVGQLCRRARLAPSRSRAGSSRATRITVVHEIAR